MRGARFVALTLLLSSALLGGGCGGEVVLGFDSGHGAVLRLHGDPVVTRLEGGDQIVSGWVENAGLVTARDVRVTVMTFVEDSLGRAVRHTDFDLPVVEEFSGLTTLHPGEFGFFETPIIRRAPPIVLVDVEIRARVPSRTGFVVFFFSPGLVIITG